MIGILLIGIWLCVAFLARHFWGRGEGKKISNWATGTSLSSRIHVTETYDDGTISMSTKFEKDGTISLVTVVDGMTIVMHGEDNWRSFLGGDDYAEWFEIEWPERRERMMKLFEETKDYKEKLRKKVEEIRLQGEVLGKMAVVMKTLGEVMVMLGEKGDYTEQLVKLEEEVRNWGEDMEKMRKETEKMRKEMEERIRKGMKSRFWKLVGFKV